jgi:hypothetical protein
MTFVELVRDYWAHLHADDPKLRERMADDNFDQTLRELGLEVEGGLLEAGPLEAAPDLTDPAETELVVSETYGDSA